jgi:NitT/TauT family transport system substrate-binding protein
MHLLMISLVAVCLLAVGCGKKNKTSPQISNAAPVTLKIGHVGHDHHLPLFVALDMAVETPETFCPKGLIVKKIVDKKRYELFKDGKALATLQIIKVGGGSKMPTALAQNVIDVGYGGTAPVLAAIDKGSPIKLISPLQSKGDMFVLDPKFPANSWSEFVRFLKKSDKPVRIGYKNPIAVAKIIFENALTHEGVVFSSDVTDSNAKVQLINVKGGGKLNSSLSNGVVSGYVGNNPFPSIGEEKKILKIICDLEELPPGNFKNHPCCCIAAVTPIPKDQAEAVGVLLDLNRSAVKLINNNPKKAAKIASRWIGTSEVVEVKSVAASSYSMDASPEWHKSMAVWVNAMNKLGFFTKKLDSLSEDEIGKKAYDFKLLKKTK